MSLEEKNTFETHKEKVTWRQRQRVMHIKEPYGLWGSTRGLERGMEWPHLPQALQKGSALLDSRFWPSWFSEFWVNTFLLSYLPSLYQPVVICYCRLRKWIYPLLFIIYPPCYLFYKRNTTLKNPLCTGSQIKCFLLKLILTSGYLPKCCIPKLTLMNGRSQILNLWWLLPFLTFRVKQKYNF